MFSRICCPGCIPVARFPIGKNIKNHLNRAKLSKGEIKGRSESSGKRGCQFCEFICNADTFTTKACSEKIQIQSGILNCNCSDSYIFIF